MQLTSSPPAVKQLLAALANAKALVASLEAAIDVVQQPIEDPALTLGAAAAATRQSAHTLRAWCKSGRLRCSRGARGAYLVRVSDINEAIAGADDVNNHNAGTSRRATVDDLDAWERETERGLSEMESGK